MDLKHLYITYSDNQYNPENDSFYAMDQSLLSIIAYDQRVANSLVFDTNRRTIYAKGMEFGGLNPVFLKVEEGTGMTGTNLAVQPTYFITSVSQDKYGQISYSYSYAYLNLSFGDGHLNNAHGGAYMTGMYVDNSGNITYEYAEVNHTTTPSNASTQANRTGKGVLIDANLSKEGNFTYSWYDASVTSGILNESYTVTNSKPLNVLTGITQSSYGQISYTYTKLNTEHYSQGTEKTDIQPYVITYAYLDKDGKFTYSWRDLETEAEDGLAVIRKDIANATITLQNAHSYRFITNINQASDGKIVYSFADVNTTHTTAETSNDQNEVITYVHIDADGNLTYHKKNLSGNTGTNSGSTDIGRNQYNVIDGISQASDGKISYTYRTISTTHETYPNEIEIPELGDDGLDVVTGISIDDNGDVSYTYSHVTINQAAQAGTLTYLENENITGQAKDHHSYLVTWIYKNEDENDKVTFTYTDISVNSGTVDTQRGKGTANATFLNNTSYRLLTNISQAGDGKISYEYADFNTSHSQVDHTRTVVQSHVITNISITADGVLSYDHKALSQTGTSKGAYIISNGDTSPEFVYNIIQNADGSITYNTHKIKTNITHSSDNVTGAVYEVSVDANGQVVSYAHKNLSGNTGSRVSAPQSSTDEMGEHIPYSPGTYTYFITGISQDAYGKVSYTYAGIYSDAENNYKWHELSISQTPTGNVSDTNRDIVNVLDGISTTNDGNAEEHEISYHTISVVTKHYVDNLMTANDALRYCGTVTPSNDENGVVYFRITHELPLTPNDTSKGAVYKVDHPGYFGKYYVTSGDMIISANDGNTLNPILDIGQRIYDASLSSDFDNWDIINNNVNLITYHKANAKNGSNVITAVNLDDAGTFSYTAYPLSVSNDPTYAATAKTTQDSKSQNILVGDNTKGFRVITDVNLMQNDLDTKLSYTYTYLYVDQNHHSNNSNGTQQKKVVSNVNLNTLGQLTYEAHALSATGTDGTAYTMTNTKGLRVLTNIWEDGDGAISYTYRDLNTVHTSTLIGETGASKVIGYVNLDADGNFTYSYVDIANATYHYAVTTTSLDSIPEVVVPYNGTSTVDLTAYSSITNDAKGHLTNSEKPTYKIKHGSVTTAYTNASENVTIPLNGTDSDGLLSYVHETIENGHVTGLVKISYNLLHGKVNGTGKPTGTKTTPNAVEISASGTDSSTILAYSAITDANGHMTAYTITDYKFKHGAVTTSYSNGSETVTIPLNGTDSDGILAYVHATTDNGHLTGLTKTSYSLVHGKINGTGNVKHSSLGQKTITIPIDTTSSVDLTSYINLKETNGHLTDETHGSYVFAHGAANTQGSAIGQNTLIIPHVSTLTSDEFVSYKSITTNNGHITSYVRTSYVLAHGLVDEKEPEDVEFNPTGTTVVSTILRENGHITGVDSTTITDVNVKFIKDQSNSVYLGGTKTATGNVITNAYTDGVSYIKNGTLYETNIQVGSNLSVGGNSTLGNAAADTVTVNASNFNWSSSQMNFTNLSSLWGTITIAN